ncbi:MAG TPA: alpha/beta hydrolase [Ramlibacter sp.]|nr:alpha/beta hydrolase [Ramlibacter sp.]
MTKTFHDLPLRRTRLESGLEFHYVQDGAGLPLVFVHGGAGDYTTWAPQWAAFSARYRAISFSRRFSQPNANPDPEPNHSALAEAEDLKQLIDCWGARPAILVAASYGAYVALALATSAPNRVRTLVLIEPPLMPWAGETAEGEKLRREFELNVEIPAREAFAAGDDDRAMTIFARGVAGPLELEKPSEARMATRLRNLRAMKVLSASDCQFPPLDPRAVERIEVPVLLVSGKNTQPLLREICTILQRHMPRAEAVVIPGAAHAVARDQPDVFNRLVIDFLARQGLS